VNFASAHSDAIFFSMLRNARCGQCMMPCSQSLT
jgi:hypothetical protein